MDIKISLSFSSPLSLGLPRRPKRDIKVASQEEGGEEFNFYFGVSFISPDYRKEKAIISASLSVCAIPPLYPLRLPRLVRTRSCCFWCCLCRAGEQHCLPPPLPPKPREITSPLSSPETHMAAGNAIHKGQMTKVFSQHLQRPTKQGELALSQVVSKFGKRGFECPT